MTANLAVRQARSRLGRVGVGLAFPPVPAEVWRREMARMEKVGYRSAWTNEGVGGKETFTTLGIALAATETLVLGTGIANIWARHPATMRAAAATLAEAYPGRLVLGVGVSHRPLVEASGQTFGKPLETQRTYLERMAASGAETVQPATPFPTIVGAIGPKMLGLSRDHADGAMPANLPVAHTEWARKLLGPDKLLVVGVSAIPDEDGARARDTARQSPLMRLPNSPHLRVLPELGYAEDDLAGGGSDRLIDDMYAHGSPDAIAARAREHLDAGADHVVMFPPYGSEPAAQCDQLEYLAPALTRL
ncbi:MAG: TIGR03620 family F420-dependent LLM class oxidoreductase [Pseudonocardiaceae bacterium]|nr:TIGR03620 family F420-dependent LLM class oxidoreductase [Pseudonocardiaceae bacterium]